MCLSARFLVPGGNVEMVRLLNFESSFTSRSLTFSLETIGSSSSSSYFLPACGLLAPNSTNSHHRRMRDLLLTEVPEGLFTDLVQLKYL